MAATTSSTKTQRAKPGAKGGGDFYRVVLRSEDQFITFRTQDVGDKGHLERIAGKRKSGSWDTQAWLISKKDAHKEGDTLVPDSKDAQDLLEQLGEKPKHKEGDIFVANRQAA